MWFADSGALKHIPSRRKWFSEFQKSKGEESAREDGKTHKIMESGTIPAKILAIRKWVDVNLENVLFVPSFKRNLFSIGVSIERKLDIRFSGESIGFYRKGKLVIHGVKQD